jgi:metallo-beta-lactamase family protein
MIAGMSGRAPTLQFLGGAGTVTGSKHLVRVGDAGILIDCGLFQGPRELRERNWIDPVADPAALDAVVLTHAHVDHCGYLPRLVASGFRGPVFTTPATAELVRIVLPDCGHLQEEEAEYANRKGFSRHRPALPLYTEDEAWKAAELLRPIQFHEPIEVARGVRLSVAPAGHILGSATVQLDIGVAGTRIGFSGDLGRSCHPFLVPPDPPGDVDWLVVESTYGDRRHEVTDVLQGLESIIESTVSRGGSVLVPAFAVDRTEVLLFHLAELQRAGRFPSGVPIYVDSPMALSALRVYRAALGRGDLDVRDAALERGDPFVLHGLHEVSDVEESKSLNHPSSPSIIISAAGMATGGRVVHHLAHFLPDSRHTVLLVGFQAQGTRGRSLLEGSTELKLLGRYVAVRASVVDLPAFSVHADSAELVAWVQASPRQPDAVYVVHGEPAASESLARAIPRASGPSAIVPRLGEIVRLDRLEP